MSGFPSPGKSVPSPRILVLAIGEAHQLLHVLGVARELARSGVIPDILVPTDWHEDLIRAHAPELSRNVLRTPLFYQGQPLYRCPPRLPNLLLSLRRISGYDAVLTPERTSTALKKLLGKQSPKLIHILHGAGDREKGYEDRIRLFDLVFVAGQKDRDAFLRYGLATADTCHVIGYCKFDVLPAAPPRFFENDRPVALYNPHFDAHLGSWLRFGPSLVEAFATMPEFNFIVAPHLRLRGKGRHLFDKLSRLSQASNLRFDGGSLHSINMDYTRTADIYVGDVSSQVYEFLQTPKPCVFLNAHDADWKDSPFYRHWTFGEVASSAEEAPALIRSAASQHPRFVALQTSGFAAAINSGADTASARAALLIRKYLASAQPAEDRP
ncbi:glycosyltransferase [Hyphomonas sp.]|uniref:glycosyltransferase n=1 Tax=Hyphomonas sp. TaxID=87 RepID=UPI0025BA0C99|nr:glycosyltransferase [Hyphomonas sp.]